MDGLDVGCQLNDSNWIRVIRQSISKAVDGQSGVALLGGKCNPTVLIAMVAGSWRPITRPVYKVPVSTKYRYINLGVLTIAVIRNAMNQDLESMLLEGDLDLRLTVSSSDVEGPMNRNIKRRSSRSDGNLEIVDTQGDWDNDVGAAELTFSLNWM